MKTTLLAILVATNFVIAGPISTMLTNDPDQVQALIDNSSYADLLQFIRDAYNECKAENNEPGAGFVCHYALGYAPLEMQIPLAIDFALSQPELELKELGAKMIESAIFQGTPVNAERRQQAVAKLKAALALLTTPSQEAYEFARQGGEALVVLGDDSGLDMFLTNRQRSGNYSRMDHWTPTSEASVFEALKQHYDLIASDPNNTNKEVEKVMASTYDLCRQRRVQGKEIKPLQPLIDIDKLLP